jgi:hypothetical protein
MAMSEGQRRKCRLGSERTERAAEIWVKLRDFVKILVAQQRGGRIFANNKGCSDIDGKKAHYRSTRLQVSLG